MIPEFLIETAPHGHFLYFFFDPHPVVNKRHIQWTLLPDLEDRKTALWNYVVKLLSRTCEYLSRDGTFRLQIIQ